jgi:hypothetical protein
MAESLGGIEQISISFLLPANEHQLLKESLRRIFQGSSCLRFADA